MRLLIVRHGDPDYSIDSLTEKGWKEAKLLSERLSKMKIDYFYVSPLGRAKDTASFTLKEMNRTAVECEWLREFEAHICRPNTPDRDTCAWDWLPEDWTREPLFYEKDLWMTQKVMADGDAKEEYDWVVQNFDQLLAKHGYRREGNLYRAERPNQETIVFFCHFGLQCVLLSHLMGISPMILWHHICTAPTSVTTLYTEERRDGIAVFRAQSIGDVSHLYAKGEEPAFSARFCEIYDSEDRHD